MQAFHSLVPHLTVASHGPFLHVESAILSQVQTIETWFRAAFRQTPAPITSSVDLRNAGFKLAPVDTNLFPAGFNNLNPVFLPLCVQAVQSVLMEHCPGCINVLVIPEAHTRNHYYWESVACLRKILLTAGFSVRFGSLDETLQAPIEHAVAASESLKVEPVVRVGDRIGLADFTPCLVLLNNDLSEGVPALLNGVKQSIAPPVALGWETRLKSSHFQHFDAVVNEFSQCTGIDSWFINPRFSVAESINFMEKSGIDILADTTHTLLNQIKTDYASRGITEKPFVAVKADNGTYGMSVMMVHDAAQVLEMNRKQRTRMAASKGGRVVSRVMIQEGVHSFETMPSGAVAEPVIYMIGQYVVGGFYRVHHGRGADDNLNAPGMHFEPLAFSAPCNLPDDGCDVPPNRFYVYGVIARLAALAAAREIAEKGAKSL